MASSQPPEYSGQARDEAGQTCVTTQTRLGRSFTLQELHALHDEGAIIRRHRSELTPKMSNPRSGRGGMAPH